MKSPNSLVHLGRSALLALSLLAFGCGSDDGGGASDGSDGTPRDGTPDGAPGDGTDGGAQGGDGSDGTGPLYAIMYEVYDDVGSTSYLSILDTLDIEQVDTGKAREYGGGRAFIQTYNGWLFVGDAATPNVTRYDVSGDGTLTESGRISWANFGLQNSSFDTWNVTFISAEKAYLMDFREGTTIIWNPTTMEILGTIEAPESLLRAGLSLEGSPAALRGNLLFRTFNWVNYDTADYSTDILLAIYDVEKDELVELVPETRCPVPGNLVHTSEDGTIYFSNWVWPVANTIMKGAPESCVLRINPDEDRFDATWTLDYGDYTQDHHGAMFSYIADAKALVSAFYDENTSFDETTSPWSYVGSLNWRIWSIDMDDPSAGKPVDGIDFNGGAFTPIQIDGRVFAMVPGGDAEGYATQVYEIDGDVATPYVKLPGWSYQFVKLR